MIKSVTSYTRTIIYIIGVLLIIGNAYALMRGYLLPARNPWEIPHFILLIESYLSNISLFPTGFPAMLSLLDKGGGHYIYIIIGIWQAAILLCGLGLVLLKDFARKTLILMCVIRFIIFLASMPVTCVLVNRLEGRVPSFSFYEITALLMPIIYIAFFLRPNVKKLFRS